MTEIQLSLRTVSLAYLVLGALVLLLGIWFGTALKQSVSTGMVIGVSVGLWGVAFIYLGAKSLRKPPHPIRYGSGKIELPERAASKEIVVLSTSDIINYGVVSYILPFIKVFEVNTKTRSAAILLDAFVDKEDVKKLVKYLEREKC
ncbi:hypothetical protein [Marinimicrobium koreense]|jgi:hypothetical protein|uniref:hypothetical protein n=1 Tax=Marinimicrobium koreense TaxID=306545 RepID=UPI003F6F94CE